jgi:putative DNA primase/helicase
MTFNIHELSPEIQDETSQKQAHLCIKKDTSDEKCNIAMACQFLTTLADGEDVTFQTFDDGIKKRSHLTKVLHGSIGDHATELQKLNSQGAGVFVTINKTDLKGRSTANITKVRAVFVDLDGAPLEPILKTPITPHIIVESSPGRYHAYWLIENLALEQFKLVQQALIARFNADKAVVDLPRVMRLPGFIHHKKDPFLTKILEKSGELPLNAEQFLLTFGIKQNSPTTSDQPQQNNNVLAALQRSGLLIEKSNAGNGGWKITCPWRHVHTTPGGESHYFEPHSNGYSGHGFKCFHKHCENRKGEDLLDWLGVKSVLTSQDNWPTPMPLPEGLPPVAELEPDMIPDPLRGWIMDIAERMQIPPDFPAASAIVVLSSLIGRKLGVLPKKQDDWLVVPNLWGAVVGRPALMKSPAIAEAIKPLDRLVKAALKDFEDSEEDYVFLKAKETALKSALGDDLKKEAKKGSPDYEKLKEKYAFDPLPKRTLKRYKTNDPSIEKVGEILLENPNGILLFRDELKGWFQSLDRYGREGDRAFWLESWNGTGSFIVDRIGRGTLHIPALCLSVLGGIQPGPLQSYVFETLKGGGGDDGLLQRFQILVWPDHPRDWKNIDRWPDTSAKNAAYEIFKKLNTYTHPLGVEDLGTEIPAIRFDDEAQALFNSWRAELERRLRNDIFSPAMESHLAKYRGLLPSLSLIFQMCEDLARCQYPECINERSLEMGIRWCKYLETHAARLYNSAENPGMESARALLKRLQKGDLDDGFSLRDVYRNEWSKLSNKEDAKAAVDILVDKDWLRSEGCKNPSGGRPAEIYRMHPQLKRV